MSPKVLGQENPIEENPMSNYVYLSETQLYGKFLQSLVVL